MHDVNMISTWELTTRFFNELVLGLGEMGCWRITISFDGNYQCGILDSGQDLSRSQGQNLKRGLQM